MQEEWSITIKITDQDDGGITLQETLQVSFMSDD